MRRSTMLCAPLLVLALLAGCDQGDDPGDTPQADSDSGTSPSDDASDGGTETGRPGTGGSACLIGSWEPSDMAGYGVDSIESLGGTFDFTMTFDDHTVSIGVTSAVPATDYTEAMDLVVAFEGDYSVSGATLKVSGLTGSTTINGATQSADPGLGYGTMDEGESDFSCSGSTLTLDGEEFSRK